MKKKLRVIKKRIPVFIRRAEYGYYKAMVTAMDAEPLLYRQWLISKLEMKL